jgi:hypothetical protein
VIEQAPPGARAASAELSPRVRRHTAAGRFRLFRYEIRCWRDGVIPDVAEAVESPQRLSADPDHARQLLELVRQVPTPCGVATNCGRARCGTRTRSSHG